MEKINIYIKGVCDYRNGRKGGYAYIVTQMENDCEKVRFSMHNTYPYVKNNYIADIEGLTDALSFLKEEVNPNIDVFTNNQALVSILQEEHYGYDYDDALKNYWNIARDLHIALNWIPKNNNNKYGEIVNRQALLTLTR